MLFFLCACHYFDDGSAAGVLEGRSYKRAFRFHKINGFQRWIEEHHEDKKPRVDKLIKGLKQLIEEVLQLFLSYSYHLSHLVIVTESFRSSGCRTLT